MPMLPIYSKDGEMPVTVQEIIRANPQTSFPDKFDPTTEGYETVAYSMPALQDDEYAVPALPVRQGDGTLVQGWEIRTYTADELVEMTALRRTRLIETADIKARELRDRITASISPAEMASWPIKRAEAMAYQARGAQATDADAPMLALEALARGCTLETLVGKVLANATTLSQLEAAIAGRCGAIQDAARAAATVADLDAIDVEVGWPA